MDYITVLSLFMLMLKSDVSDIASGTAQAGSSIVVAWPSVMEHFLNSLYMVVGPGSPCAFFILGLGPTTSLKRLVMINGQQYLGTRSGQ